MVDADILLAPFALLQLSQCNPSSSIPSNEALNGHGITKPIHVKKGDEKPFIKKEEHDDNGSRIEPIHPTSVSNQSKRGLRLDCCVHLPNKTPISTPLESPAAKGWNYSMDFEAADVFLKERIYFVEGDPGAEYSVYSIGLGLGRNIVSLVDANGTHRGSHDILYMEETDQLLKFCIGFKLFLWSRQNFQLHCYLPNLENNNQIIVQPVTIHNNIGGAWDESHNYSLNLIEQHWPLAQTRNNPVTDNSREIQGQDPLMHSFTGHSQYDSLLDLSPSPASTAGPSAPRSHPPKPQSKGPLKLGDQAQKVDIDDWVDELVGNPESLSRDKDGNIACPEAGCESTARRPSALKDHLYTHYGTRPFGCLMKSCPEAFATLPNMKRHHSKIHLCDHCDAELPRDELKRHKTLCIKRLDKPLGKQDTKRRRIPGKSGRRFI